MRFRHVVAALIVATLTAMSISPASARAQGEILRSEIAAIERSADGTELTLAISVPGIGTDEAPTVTFDRGTSTRVAEALVTALDSPPTVVLTFDTSGSMAGQRLIDARLAAESCIARLPRETRIGLVAYADGVTQRIEPTLERQPLIEAIAATIAAGETATFDAVIAGVEVGSSRTDARVADAGANLEDRASRFIALLSDGEDTVSQASAADAIAALERGGFRLYALGIEPEQAFLGTLESLTSAPNSELVLGGPADFGSLCQSVSDQLASRFVMRMSFTDPQTQAFTAALTFPNGVSLLDIPAAPTPPEDDESPGTAASSTPAGGDEAAENSAGDDRSSSTDQPTDEASGGSNVGTQSGDAGDTASPDTQTAAPTAPSVPAPPLEQSSAQPRSGPTQLQLWLGAATVTSSPLLLALALLPGRRVRHRLRIRRPRTQGLANTMSGLAGRLLAQADLQRSVDRRLELAAVSLRAGEFVAGVAGAALAVAVVLAVLGLGPTAIVALLAIPLGSWMWLKRRGDKRAALFQEQLGDTLLVLSGALRAGNSTVQALAAAADKAPSPNAEEFQRVVAEARIGRDLVSALEDLADRMGSEDAHWMVEAIALNRELGGNLAGILDNVAETMQARAQIQSQVRIMSAEGRLTATILLALPFAVAGFLQFLNPGYLSTLFTERNGNVILGVALGLMVFGAFWVSRLIKLEY